MARHSSPSSRACRLACRSTAEWVDHELARRMQGYGRGARMKIERDRIEWLSGLRAGETLGSPVAMLIPNRDWANWEDVMAYESSDPPGRAPTPAGHPAAPRATPIWPACSSTTGSTDATSWSAPAPGKPPPASPPARWPSGCCRNSGWRSEATSSRSAASGSNLQWRPPRAAQPGVRPVRSAGARSRRRGSDHPADRRRQESRRHAGWRGRGGGARASSWDWAAT